MTVLLIWVEDLIPDRTQSWDQLAQTRSWWVVHFLVAAAVVEQNMSDGFGNPEKRANPCCSCVRTANAELEQHQRERFGKEDAAVFSSSKMAFSKSNSEYSLFPSFQNSSFTDRRERREGESLEI